MQDSFTAEMYTDNDVDQHAATAVGAGDHSFNFGQL